MQPEELNRPVAHDFETGLSLERTQIVAGTTPLRDVEQIGLSCVPNLLLFRQGNHAPRFPDFLPFPNPKNPLRNMFPLPLVQPSKIIWKGSHFEFRDPPRGGEFPQPRGRWERGNPSTGDVVFWSPRKGLIGSIYEIFA